MPRQEPQGTEPADNGLRRMLIWTLVALVVSLLLAVLGVNLAIHFFDRP